MLDVDKKLMADAEYALKRTYSAGAPPYYVKSANALSILLKRIEALRELPIARLKKHRFATDYDCPCAECVEDRHLLATDERMANGYEPKL
jgi:hypothetical protein